MAVQKFFVARNGELYKADYTQENTQKLYETGGRWATPEDVEALYYDAPVSTGAFAAADSLLFNQLSTLASAFGYGEEVGKHYKYNPYARVTGEVLGLGAGMLIGSGELGVASKIARATPAVKVALGSERFAARLLGELGITSPKAIRAGSRILGGMIEGGMYETGHAIGESALGNTELNAELLVGAAGRGMLAGGLVGGAVQGLSFIGRRGARAALNKVEREASAAFLDTATQKKLLKEGSKEAVEQELRGHIKLGVTRPAEMLESLKGTREEVGKTIGSFARRADDINPVAISDSALKKRLNDWADTLPAGVAEEQSAIKKIKNSINKINYGKQLSHADLENLKASLGKQTKWDQLTPPTTLEYKRKLYSQVKSISEESIERDLSGVASIQDFIDAKKRYGTIERAIAGAEKQALKESTRPAESLLSLGSWSSRLGAGIGFGVDGLSGGLGGMMVPALIKKLSKIPGPTSYAIGKKIGVFPEHLTHSAVTAGIGATQHGFLKRIEKAALSLTSASPRAVRKATIKAAAMAYSDDELMHKAQLYSAANDSNLVNRIADFTNGSAAKYAPKITGAVSNKIVEMMAALKSAAPKNPYTPGSRAYKNWKPTKTDLAKFNSTLLAIEDPAKIVEDVAKGKIDRVAVETIEKVYPQIFQLLQYAILDHVVNSKKEIPYERRLMLSYTFNLPIDESYGNLLELQKTFTTQVPPESTGSMEDNPKVKRFRKNKHELSEREEVQY